MKDRKDARREFLRQMSAARIERIASSIETACGSLAANDVAAVREILDEISWMIGWALPGESLEVRTQLVELHMSLPEWRSAGRSELARVVAHDCMVAWVDKLRWLAARLEAAS